MSEQMKCGVYCDYVVKPVSSSSNVNMNLDNSQSSFDAVLQKTKKKRQKFVLDDETNFVDFRI